MNNIEMGSADMVDTADIAVCNESINDIIQKIKEDLPNYLPPKTLKHSMGVCDMAVKMAKIYGVDTQKARVAALLHDLAKPLSDEELLEEAKNRNIKIDDISKKSPFLLHGPVAADMARQIYNIDDVDILNAIYYHTYGGTQMSDLEKIIYVADAIEMGRDYPQLEKTREIALNNLDDGVMAVLKNTINHVLSKNQFLHINTIMFWNELVGNR